MSRERVDGDGPKCRCGRPAVWSGFCEMADGKGWCGAAPSPQPASKSPEAEPVVTRAHREAALKALFDVTDDEIARSQNAVFRWLRESDESGLLSDTAPRVAQALATAEHSAKRSAWREGYDAALNKESPVHRAAEAHWLALALEDTGKQLAKVASEFAGDNPVALKMTRAFAAEFAAGIAEMAAAERARSVELIAVLPEPPNPYKDPNA